MLTPIRNHLTNLEVGKPADWDEATQGECLSLPVHRSEDGFYSWYSFSWLDRLRILFGVPLRLFIMMPQHPVISLEVQKS